MNNELNKINNREKKLSIVTGVIIVIALILTTLVFIYASNNEIAYMPKVMAYETELFSHNEIMSVNIIADDDKWQSIMDNAMSEEYTAVDVEVNGVLYKNVGFRPKGNSTLMRIAQDSTTDRFSYKIKFDEYIEGQTCMGLDLLILNNVMNDNTYMKDFVAYEIMNYIDADALLYNYVEMNLNDDNIGLYLAVEGYEDSFQARTYGHSNGYLYKVNSNSMDVGAEKTTERNPTENNSQMGNTPQGEMSQGNNSQMGNVPQGEIPQGNNSQMGNTQQGEIPQANNSQMMGNAQQGEMSQGNNSQMGNTPQGEIPQGNNSQMGNAPQGEIPQGNNSQMMGNAPQGEIPQGNNSQMGNTQQGEIPQGNNSQMGNTPQGEMSQGNNSQMGNTQQGEIPQGNNSQMGNAPQEEMSQGNNSQMGNTQQGETPQGNNSQTQERPTGESSKGQGGGMGSSSSSTGGGNFAYIDDNIDSYSDILLNSIGNTAGYNDNMRVIEAIKALENGTDNIEEYWDVDNILRFFAAHTTVVNMDSFSAGRYTNLYVYEYKGKMNLIPWDYNESFAGAFATGVDLINSPIDTPVINIDISEFPLLDILLGDEYYKNLYHEYLLEICTYLDNSTDRINEIDSQINELVKNDPTAFVTYENYEKGVAELKNVLLLRSESIKGQIAGTIPSTTQAQAQNPELLLSHNINTATLGSNSGGGMGGGGNGDRSQGRGDTNNNTMGGMQMPDIDSLGIDLEALSLELGAEIQSLEDLANLPEEYMNQLKAVMMNQMQNNNSNNSNMMGDRSQGGGGMMMGGMPSNNISGNFSSEYILMSIGSVFVMLIAGILIKKNII